MVEVNFVTNFWFIPKLSLKSLHMLYIIVSNTNMGPVDPMMVKGCPANRWYNDPAIAPPNILSIAAILLSVASPRRPQNRVLKLPQFRFFKKHFFEISTFVQNFNICPKFQHLSKISTFVQNVNICPKCQHLSKISTFVQNFNICPKCQHLSKISIFNQKSHFIKRYGCRITASLLKLFLQMLQLA